MFLSRSSHRPHHLRSGLSCLECMYVYTYMCVFSRVRVSFACNACMYTHVCACMRVCIRCSITIGIPFPRRAHGLSRGWTLCVAPSPHCSVAQTNVPGAEGLRLRTVALMHPIECMCIHIRVCVLSSPRFFCMQCVH